MDDLERLMTQHADWIYVLLFAYAFVKTGPLPVAAAYAATLGWLHAGARDLISALAPEVRGVDRR